MEPFSELPVSKEPKQIEKWVASRYNILSLEDNGDLYISNTYTGALFCVPKSAVSYVKKILRDGVEELDETSKILSNYGFLIKSTVNEMNRARVLHEIQGRSPENMYLIFLTTEQCNFRCTYCYEKFEKGKMSKETIKGVINYVRKRAPYLKNFSVHWFGGEPLIAMDVIEELSREFIALSKEYSFNYRAGVTTNGYLLSQSVAQSLLDFNVDNFQITLDGDACHHNKTRKLMGGQGTFEKIYNNLKGLKDFNENFNVRIRINFTKDNSESVPEFVNKLEEDFKGDPRFHINFFPVGHWGGPNDEEVEVFDTKEGAKTALSLCELSLEKGFSTTMGNLIKPGGYVCYAADPNSFVIGSDGIIYKCTVALYNDKNKVGQIDETGNLNLDMDKYALWVMSDESEDEGCKKCFLRPSCQGSACPLVRIETGKAPCPPEKKHIKTVVKIVGRQKKYIKSGKILQTT
jgi:uncharacterized protein